MEFYYTAMLICLYVVICGHMRLYDFQNLNTYYLYVYRKCLPNPDLENHFCVHTYFLFIDLKEREKHLCEKEMWIRCLPNISWPVIEPGTWACALTGNWAGDFWCTRQCSNTWAPLTRPYLFSQSKLFKAKAEIDLLKIKF